MQLDELIARPDRWARLLGRATMVGVACGVVGPFGSYPANAFTRLAFWTGLFWAGTLLLWPWVMAALAWATRRGVPPGLAGGVAALSGSVPLAVLAATLGRLFWPVHASAMRPLEWYGDTLIVALPMLLAMIRLEGIEPAGDSARRLETLPAIDAVPQAGPRLGVLPLHLIEGALCLQMEDHHVRVHTAGRSHLHLAPMRDAVEALGDARGLQVHRSWWVARAAVRGVEEDGRAVTLLLTNGLRVPVARSRVAALRAQGWLDPRG